LPVFLLAMGPAPAVAAVAAVHLFHNLGKFILLRSHVDRRVLVQFGAPALAAAALGAWGLAWLTDLPELGNWSLFGKTFSLCPLKLVIGLSLAVLSGWELLGGGGGVRGVPLWAGGLASGLLGGLTGHQGAIRSAFFLGKDLPKETFIATGAAVACAVDITRIAVYVQLFHSLGGSIPWPVVGAGIVGAAVGLSVGSIGLRNAPARTFRKIIGIALMVFGLGLASGLIS
jgi:uncharacterized membrane protein YfcA